MLLCSTMTSGRRGILEGDTLNTMRTLRNQAVTFQLLGTCHLEVDLRNNHRYRPSQMGEFTPVSSSRIFTLTRTNDSFADENSSFSVSAMGEPDLFPNLWQSLILLNHR
ncbi:hypothetical protein NW756_012189 [Fusarium oxysporum]|nr:hypothetical protein NW763_010609 [Fusarium oxysporum]KAJ4046495.1 hypothetical protein NW753_009314 [Fusarium oxysporum]KAJ4078170.1 hypothetical protein NW756_012189 [Fusarium oxysporum]KAJ4096071.1 hypothetical protein NW769_011679 [Fusarium oxysporum]KAJ4216882.1 hypothetical protein NW760_013499 [Fusarium oxysporum]